MLKRHETQLRCVLDEVEVKGYTIIDKRLMRLWFDTDRLGKKSWREILDMLPESLSDDEAVEIFEKGDIVIIFDRGCIRAFGDYTD